MDGLIGGLFTKKTSLARRLSTIILKLSGLYLVGFFGFLVASQTQLKGLGELYNLTKLNNSTIKSRVLISNLKQKIERKENIPESDQVVLLDTLNKAELTLKDATSSAATYEDIHTALLEAEKSFQLFKNSMSKLFSSTNSKQKSLLEFKQYGLELRDALAKADFVIVSQTDFVFQELYSQRFFPLFIGLIVAIFSVFFALASGSKIKQHIMNSILELTQAIQDVARGNFVRRASVLADDEIGHVAEGFNKMTAILQETTVSRYFVESVIDSMVDSVIVTDSDGKVTRVNDAAISQFGYDEYSMLHQSVSMFFVDPKTVPSKVENAERLCVTREGKSFPALVTASSIFSQEEKSDALVYVIKDITRRKRFEVELKNRNAELAAVNRELEAFSYSVSHDLRVPLRAIDTFSLALIEDNYDQLSEEGREHLDRIRSGVKRMGRLIEDLLNLSRLSREQLELRLVNIGSVAKNILEDLMKSQPDRQVTFDIEPGLEVVADANMLKVALSNLIENAWKYTSKHKTAKIEIGHKNIDGRTVYYIRDDGAGFDMNYSSKLFRAFQRLHANSDFPGTGIGLAIVQRIISRHGGKLWAEGKPEQGATFYFTL